MSQGQTALEFGGQQTALCVPASTHLVPVSLQQRGTARLPSAMPSPVITMRLLAPSRVSLSPLTSHRTAMQPCALSRVSPRPLTQHPGGTGLSPAATPQHSSLRQSLPVVRPAVNALTPKDHMTTDVCRAIATATKNGMPSFASPTASTRASSCRSPRIERVAFQEDRGREETKPPDVNEFTEPSTPREQLLKERLRKTSQQLQHQQSMVKTLMQHIQTERERRVSLEDALVEGCLCRCYREGTCQTSDP